VVLGELLFLDIAKFVHLLRHRLALADAEKAVCSFCSIFPSPEPPGVQSGVVHVPIPCSTGSLPNLSDLNFSLPLTVPIDVDSACCGPGGGPLPNYSVADSSATTQTGTGTVPLRLNRQMVPVPLVLLGGQNAPNEVCCIA